MNHPVDVHPEDLLDRERRGMLVPDERRRLDAHATHCSACALERNVVFEFANERRTGREDDAAVSRLILGAVTVASETQTMRRPIDFRVRKATGLRRWALVSAVAAAGTAAVALGLLSLRAPRVPEVPASAAPVVTVEVAPRQAAAAEVVGSVPAEVLPPEVEPVTPRPHARRAVERGRRAVVPRNGSERPEQVSAGVQDLQASELFARANEARRRGDSAEAIRLYGLLRQRFAGSREEITSRVALGRLLLDRMDEPSAALSMFDRYLMDSADGTLAEEARLGRALALMRLGRSAEERQAWQQLLTAHPRSVQAERARRRLEELH
jgi:hypothetical protein